MSAPFYPVHVDAQLDPHLSRWLWLVKWFLAIPHYFILAFLWVAFVLLSAVAMVAIVVTGRYPAAIFEFNVGVLRWSWRVSYYTYGALATDRYPPFTLAEVPDYPAHLSVDYPEHLSRGLVLVKWWLLAIPHYIIVGLLVSGGIYIAWGTAQGEPEQWTWGGGLIGILAIIAAVILLMTGRYPQQMFDLILGLNRWVLRVAAYAGLMTDEYPPFRLDMGGADPSPARVAVPATPAPAAPEKLTWSGGRIATMVIAALVFLVAGGLLTGGTTLAVADQTLRNDQGFLMSSTQTLSTSTYAVVTEPVTLETGANDAVPQNLVGDVALRARGIGGEEVFVGLAPSADVDAFLSGVEHVTLVDIRGFGGSREPVYTETRGGAPSVQPGDSDIWVEQTTGTGEQQLTWKPKSGEWTVLVMNADGGAGVDADVAIGATAPVLGWMAVALLVTGGLLLLLSIGLVLAALYAGRRPSS